MNTKKYGQETIMLITGLADKGMTVREASISLGIPKGSISTLASKNDIRFKGSIGRKRVENPVRPYRPYQKPHYKLLEETIDATSFRLMTQKW